MSNKDIKTGVIAAVDLVLLLCIAALAQQVIELKHQYRQQWNNQHIQDIQVQKQIDSLDNDIHDVKSRVQNL